LTGAGADGARRRGDGAREEFVELRSGDAQSARTCGAHGEREQARYALAREREMKTTGS